MYNSILKYLTEINIVYNKKFGFCSSYLTLIQLLFNTQPAFTCSMLTIDTLEQGVKYFQS